MSDHVPHGVALQWRRSILATAMGCAVCVMTITLVSPLVPAVVAQTPEPQATPSSEAPVEIDAAGSTLPAPEDTPTPTPAPGTPTPTPTPPPGVTPPAPVSPSQVPPRGNNAAAQEPEDKKYEAETRCLPNPSRLLAQGGAEQVEVEPRSWSWLAFLIAGACGLLVVGAYAVRRLDRRRDQASRGNDKPPPASLLEVVATVVGICATIAGVVTSLVPGVGARERPSPAITMTVRAVNARVTRAEYARNTGIKRQFTPPDGREVGNVIWVQLHFTGYQGRELRLQWGSYDATPGAGGALVAATTSRGILLRPQQDDVVRFQPVWVGYPSVKRFRVQFRLLERGEVREIASTGGMNGDLPRYRCDDAG